MASDPTTPRRSYVCCVCGNPVYVPVGTPDDQIPRDLICQPCGRKQWEKMEGGGDLAYRP